MVSRWKTVSVLFTVFLAVSLYGCYRFISTPSTLSTNTVDLQYVQRADYSYTAQVKPSLLYDNRTQISNEPLYLKLVEQLEITLQYNLTQNPKTFEMTDATVKYDASATIKGESWTKTYLLKPAEEKNLTFTDTYTLNMEEVNEVVETIGEETGIFIRTYSYMIQPHIHLEASAGGEQIEQDFNPNLTVKFEGGKIEFEGLENVNTGSVTHRETEVATLSLLGSPMSVGVVKTASALASTSLAIFLAISLRFTLRERASRTLLEKLSGDVREKIIEASEPSEHVARETIKVSSIDDLAKVSEETFKPIIHHGQIFYVLDGDIKYEFKKT
jgi:hypothetical protein